MDNDTIPRKEALRQVRQALRRVALIYHHFAATAVAELGEEKGKDFVRKAVEAYGAQIGEEARHKASAKGLSLNPEHFESDLPAIAWDMEEVTVDGEKRTRITHCPLAAEWLAWGDCPLARLYCRVDQAKMKAFNPEYEYVHLKTVLDGDPHCELAVRRAGTKRPAPGDSNATRPG